MYCTSYTPGRKPNLKSLWWNHQKLSLSQSLIMDLCRALSPHHLWRSGLSAGVGNAIVVHWSAIDVSENSSLRNGTVHNTWAINHSVSIKVSRVSSNRVAFTSDLSSWSPADTAPQDVSGDLGFRSEHFGVGAGVLHVADRLLESVLTGWDGHHYGDLLVQPVEDLCDWFNWSVQLQRLRLDAGAGWSAAVLLPQIH